MARQEAIAEEGAEVRDLLERPHRWFPPPTPRQGGEVEKAWADVLLDRELLRCAQERQRRATRGPLSESFGERRKHGLTQRCAGCDHDAAWVRGLCRRCYMIWWRAERRPKVVKLFLRHPLDNRTEV